MWRISMLSLLVQFNCIAAMTAVKAPVPGPPVKLSFSDVGARVPCEAPPLVVLHGLFGAGGNFGTWAASLAEDQAKSGTPRRVLLVDLRNHGGSPHSGEMSFSDMASDVAFLLEEQGIRRAVLCGHSIGGKVAMATALLYPSLVERLMVLDMAPVSYEPEEPQWDSILSVVKAMRTVRLDSISSKRDADAMLSRTVSDPGLRAFVLMNLVRTQDGRFRWRVNLDAIERSLPQLGAWDIEGPEGCSVTGDSDDTACYDGFTLFVGGGKSRFLRSSHLAEIEKQFSKFSLSTIRSASHWIHADEPEALMTIASNFLSVKQP
jgi:esterase